MADNTTPQENTELNVEDTPNTPADAAEETLQEAPAAAPVEDATDAELARVKAEAQQYLDGWQRERADFANYKKRIDRERLDIAESAKTDVIKELLSIVDDFERALENIPEEFAAHAWVDGTAAIGRKLSRFLEKHEIVTIDPVGQPFDPDKHQGLGVDENAEVPSGHVSQTLQKGYMRGDKVLRPALVKIAG